MKARAPGLAALVLAFTAAPAAALAPPSPYLQGPAAAVNAAGDAVVAWVGPSGVRAALGSRLGFGPAVPLSGPEGVGPPARVWQPEQSPVQVAIDDAGTAIVVWETTRRVMMTGCGRHCPPPSLTSTGVWASVRPAGGSLQPPIALDLPRGDDGGTANPNLAMSPNGHAVVAWNGPDGRPLVSLRGPGGALQQAQPAASRAFGVHGVAITDAGETLVAGAGGQLVVRPPNGAFGEPLTFPSADRGPALVAANARGDAVFAYIAVGGVRIGQRPAGGAWDATSLVGTPAGSRLRAVTMTGDGEGVALWGLADIFPKRGLVAASVRPAAAPSVQPLAGADPRADGAYGDRGLAAGPNGEVAAAWTLVEVNVVDGRTAQVAIRRSPGAFGTPVTITPADAEHPIGDYPDVAVAAGGAVLATWVDAHPGEWRVKAAWLIGDGPLPATILETRSSAPPAGPASPPAPPPPPVHVASIPLPTTGVRPTPRGFVGIRMRCVSLDGQPCRGTLTLRHGAGGLRAGSTRFAIRAPRARVLVGLNRRTRNRLRRHSRVTLVASVTPAVAGVRGTTRRVVVLGRSRTRPQAALARRAAGSRLPLR